MKKQIIQLRIFLWSLLGLSLIWFAWMKIVPTGHISYKVDSFGDNFFIGKLGPEDRIASQNILLGDPVYFSLFTPRRFDRAQIQIEYNNETSKNLAELGVMVGQNNWEYRLEPLENRILDNLSGEWFKITEGGRTLLQRKERYQNIDSFLDNLPERDKIALYNTELDDEYLISDYQADNYSKTFTTPLRGRYGFYTYIKGENFDWKLVLQDLNENKDSDEIDVDLYYGNQAINSWHLDDDGIVLDNGHKSEERVLDLKLKNLPEGVYKVEVKTNDDIITKRISTSQSKLSFYGTLYLAKTENKNFKLFTDAQEVAVKTVSPDSLQDILINNKTLSLKKTYTQFSAKTDSSDISEIDFEKDSLIIATDGVLSFSREMLINPNFRKVDDNLGLKKIDYILADYKSNIKTDFGKIATIDLDLTNGYREKGAYSFIISIPGLMPEMQEKFTIKQIKVDLFGKSLLEKIKEIF